MLKGIYLFYLFSASKEILINNDRDYNSQEKNLNDSEISNHEERDNQQLFINIDKEPEIGIIFNVIKKKINLHFH